jgi:hypothetical protein
MTPDQALAAGTVIAYIVSGIAVLSLWCWLLYTIIWRAVARGIHTHEAEAQHLATFDPRVQEVVAAVWAEKAARDARPQTPGEQPFTLPSQEGPHHAPPGTGAELREGPGPRDW